MSHRSMAALWVLAAVPLTGLVCTALGEEPQSQTAPASGKANVAPAQSPEQAAIQKSAEAFAQAFNSGDAAAVAKFWTPAGEYVGDDGQAIRGRDAIEQAYTQFFKQHPQARIETQIDSIRLLGRFVAQERGQLKLFLKDQTSPAVSNYSVLHVLEDGQWLIASSREQSAAAALHGNLSDLAWLVGDWHAKTEQGELKISYAWDDAQTFLHARYELWRDGAKVSTGDQILGNTPGGGVTAWLFSSTGVTGQSWWVREDDRWAMNAVGLLPDGSLASAVNLLVPIDNNAFTWQSVERAAAGVSLPDTPPLKVVRNTDSK